MFSLTNGDLIKRIKLSEPIPYIGLARNLRFYIPPDQQEVIFTVKDIVGKVHLSSGKIEMGEPQYNEDTPAGSAEPRYTCSITPAIRNDLYVVGYYGTRSPTHRYLLLLQVDSLCGTRRSCSVLVRRHWQGKIGHIMPQLRQLRLPLQRMGTPSMYARISALFCTHSLLAAI